MPDGQHQSGLTVLRGRSSIRGATHGPKGTPHLGLLDLKSDPGEQSPINMEKEGKRLRGVQDEKKVRVRINSRHILGLLRGGGIGDLGACLIGPSVQQRQTKGPSRRD